MALTSGPRRQVDSQVRVAARHLQAGVGGQAGEGVLDDQVAAAVKAQAVKVDSRQP
jgi:hypothetical protein